MYKHQKGTISIAAVSVSIAVIVIVLMGLALKFIYDKNTDLIKKNGELVQQVKTISDSNTLLAGQFELKNKLTQGSGEVSEVHEKEVRVIYKEVEKQTKSLPKPIVKEKDTRASSEQNINTVKRIDTLWLAYCTQTSDNELCPVTEENTKEKA